MKAISLWQPYASLIALGEKRWETRSWATAYRGPLAIHAAERWGRDQLALSIREPFYTPLAAAGFCGGKRRHRTGLEFGAVIAVCELVDCLEIGPTRLLRNDAGHRARVLPPEPERSFGDYTPGRFAWELADVRPLARPVPFRGRQKLFDVPDELIRAALIPSPPEEP
jgi:hypothetical protein